VRKTFVLHGNSLETNGSAASLTCGSSTLKLALGGLHPAGAKAVAKTRLIVAQPSLIVRPAFIARPPQPGVELVLHGALDDQPGPEPGQLRQRLPGFSPTPNGKQGVDLLLDLRRRRYGASHGEGPPSIVLSGLEGTYAVPLTGLAIYSSWETRPPGKVRSG
jgi:hypothetical protein